MTGADLARRYYVTYSGVKPPVRLVDPIGEAELNNRNTFVVGYFDAKGRLVSFEKLVYGQTELSHHYTYRADGTLERATIRVDEEETTLVFSPAGQALTTNSL
jgi:hypothetical protein